MIFLKINKLNSLPSQAETPSGGELRSYVLEGFLLCGGFIFKEVL
jgi:hypothetical protein